MISRVTCYSVLLIRLCFRDDLQSAAEAEFIMALEDRGKWNSCICSPQTAVGPGWWGKASTA